MTRSTDAPQFAGDKNDPAIRAQIAEYFSAAIPFYRALGIELVAVDTEVIQMRVPYRPEFVGDAAAGLWHTSVATALADSACGLAVLLTLPGAEGTATLDLRMDYLRPAVAGEDLYVTAECHHLTRRVAFARATLHQGNRDRPTAHCTGAFMRTARVPA